VYVSQIIVLKNNFSLPTIKTKAHHCAYAYDIQSVPDSFTCMYSPTIDQWRLLFGHVACTCVTSIIQCLDLFKNGIKTYSGERLEVSSLLGEDLSDTTPSRVLTLSLIFIDSCIH
jgi:hypothetical protein